eukprot:1147257-Prymnesium_polylepis.1
MSQMMMIAAPARWEPGELWGDGGACSNGKRCAVGCVRGCGASAGRARCWLVLALPHRHTRRRPASRACGSCR